MAENTDTRFLNVCGRHLEVFRVEARWNPSNEALKIANLEALLEAGYPVVDDVWAKFAPFEMKINRQQAAFDKIEPRVRAARRYLKSSGATEAEIADVNTVINDLLGEGTASKPPADPDNPAADIEKSNSVSQMSYDSRLGNLVRLRELFANIAAYKPNEDDIKLDAFDALIDECRAAIEARNAAFVPLFNAWNLRDAKLYDDADSILETFRDAKEYYKSLYAPDTPQYRAITERDMKLLSNSRS